MSDTVSRYAGAFTPAPSGTATWQVALAEIRAVPQLIPGMNAKSLANYDCDGTGPSGWTKIGRRVLYDRDQFVDWLEKQAGMEGGGNGS